jgi:hypothetical protein
MASVAHRRGLAGNLLPAIGALVLVAAEPAADLVAEIERVFADNRITAGAASEVQAARGAIGLPGGELPCYIVQGWFQARHAAIVELHRASV